MFEVLIVLNGQKHGLRYWSTVPRVGDLVEVKVDGVPLDAEVIQVRWRGQTDIESRDGKGRVTLVCTLKIG